MVEADKDAASESQARMGDDLTDGAGSQYVGGEGPGAESDGRRGGSRLLADGLWYVDERQANKVEGRSEQYLALLRRDAQHAVRWGGND